MMNGEDCGPMDAPAAGGPGDKIKELMAALAALLQPQAAPEDQAAPAEIASAGSGANTEMLSALLEKLVGQRQSQPNEMADSSAPVATMPGMSAGTPEDDSGAESDDTAEDAVGGLDAEKDAANGPPIATANKAKGAMSKLAKARAGK